jgi:replicative DNA helicase
MELIPNTIEWQLLASVFSGTNDERETVLNRLRPDHFVSDNGKEIAQRVWNEFKHHPQADTAYYSGINSGKDIKAVLSALYKSGCGVYTGQQLAAAVNSFRELRESERAYKNMLDVIMDRTKSKREKLAEIQGCIDASHRYTAAADSGNLYIANYSEKPKHIGTGFPEIDHLLGGGFKAGTVATIGARPSTGKTTLALNIAASDPGVKTVIFTLEMTSGDIYDKLIADKANVNYKTAQAHEVRLETCRRIIDRYKNMTVIDDVYEIEDICEIIREMRPDIVVVDYVQIIRSHLKFPDNRQRIDYISQLLKAATKAVKCCTILLSQLTRQGKVEPQMTDLKESGGLEQDSDYVILMHRPYVLDKSEGVDKGETKLKLDKNKYGLCGIIHMNFVGNYQRFEEEQIAHPAPPDKDEKPISADDDLPF